MMIEIPCYHTMEGNLEAELGRIFRQYSLDRKPIPSDEVFSCLEKFGEITKFAKLLTTFLSHYKSNRWAIHDLQRKARSMPSRTQFGFLRDI